MKCKNHYFSANFETPQIHILQALIYFVGNTTTQAIFYTCYYHCKKLNLPEVEKKKRLKNKL